MGRNGRDALTSNDLDGTTTAASPPAPTAAPVERRRGDRRKSASSTGYGNIYTPHAGSMIIQVQRESGLQSRTIVLSPRHVRVLRLFTSRTGKALAGVVITVIAVLAVEAARVPSLTFQISRMQHTAQRLDTLEHSLARAPEAVRPGAHDDGGGLLRHDGDGEGQRAGLRTRIEHSPRGERASRHCVSDQCRRRHHGIGFDGDEHRRYSARPPAAAPAAARHSSCGRCYRAGTDGRRASGAGLRRPAEPTGGPAVRQLHSHRALAAGLIVPRESDGSDHNAGRSITAASQSSGPRSRADREPHPTNDRTLWPCSPRIRLRSRTPGPVYPQKPHSRSSRSG